MFPLCVGDYSSSTVIVVLAQETLSRRNKMGSLGRSDPVEPLPAGHVVLCPEPPDALSTSVEQRQDGGGEGRVRTVTT